MKTRYLYITVTLLSAICLAMASCKKFLDEKPTKGNAVVISSTADLNAILNYYQDFYAEKDNVVIYGTDDNGFSADIYNARPFQFTSTNIQFSLWDIANLPQTDQSNFSGKNFWSGEYAKILNANLVLANVDAVSGTASEKASLKADAYFIRAYSYWQLANTYCLPYTNATANEPGLPLQLKPDYTVAPRSTLTATYTQIEADLTEALKTTVPLVQNGKNRPWRANTAAVNAFAARYYLNLGNYTRAAEYASASLAAYNTLVDYNTEMRYGTPTALNVNGSAVTVQFPYTHDRDILTDPTFSLAWKESLYYRVLINDLSWYIPSQELLSLYDQNNDLRFKYHMVKDYSYTRGFTNPALSYPGYVFFFNDALPEGPTVAEMVLTKAECEARSGNVAGALTTVNQLYSKRTVTGTAPLTAGTQDGAIAVVLKERRRELPFTQRWFDIRRFNSNDYAGDDVPVLTKSFYPYDANNVDTSKPLVTYTLLKGSRRFASPLPQNDVVNSNGTIPQNTY